MAVRNPHKSQCINSAYGWLFNLGLVMIPDHSFSNFFSKHEQQCNCEYCRSLNVDWTKLSNTEKMAKALISKANIIAELNSSKTKIN